jgi:mono/diheme cytochrome c family protein
MRFILKKGINSLKNRYLYTIIILTKNHNKEGDLMKYSNYIIAIAAFLFLSIAAQAQDKKAETGKDVFQNLKCGMCHAVESEKLTTKGKAPDLSTIGTTKKADWIAKYLKKEEKLNDKAHAMAFKGTDEELKTLSTWLASLKKAAK